tara:strand:- start:31977 stop:33791 length:1815 start_codon:yes stop_codon:yes gene_type:complete
MSKLFESAFSNAGIGIAIVGLDGEFLRVNDAFCEISGHSAENLLNGTFQDITHPDDLDADLNFLRQLNAGEIDRYNLRKRYIAEDGTERPIILTASRIVSDDGQKTLKYIAQIQDRKEIEDLTNELFQLHKIKDIAFESTKTGTWSWEIGADDLTWDRHMISLYEAEEKEVYSYDDWKRVIHPSDVEKAEEDVRKAIEDTGIFESEFRIRANSGVKYIYARGKVIEFENKKLLIGINIDMTSEYEARIKLRDSQELLDQTQSLTRIGGWKYVVENDEITWSNTVYDIHDVPYDYQINKQGALNFFPGEARHQISQALENAIEKGQPYDLELPFVTAKNSRLWVRCIGQPIIDKGQVVHIVGCIMDVSNQVSMRNSLEKANAELARFAYAASHDLREPLRKITAFGDLLEKSLGDKLTDKEKRFMGHMIKGARKMQQQIDDLLALSRVNTTNLELEEVDLNEIVADALEDIATVIVESDARIKVEKLPTIKACKPLLRSLVFNIVSNAIKYRDDSRQPQIRIWHGQHEGIGALFVKDNGIGFDPQYKDQIFEPFKRLHTGERYGGNGIGLATCSRVCERHGWVIGAESKEKEGSTFWFTTESIYG